MRFRDDTRGVTVQVGAVLLFATIIIALSVYQATVVPSENADVEYRHSQQVQGQLVDVRNALVATAETGDARPATVSLGTEYPNRVFLVNPPPAAGALRTDTYDDPNIEVSNVNATNPETRDYLDGSWAQPTKSLSYVPDYNEYRDAPRLRYEASFLSNYYPEQNTSVPLTDQLLVDSETRTISLVALNGSLGTSRSSSMAVSPTALSAPAERVQVQPENSTEPVNVTVPTVVDAGVLRNSTDLGDNPNVTVVQNGTERVTLSIDWSGPFTLQTAKVGVGSDTTDAPPHYLTVVASDDDSVTVEARDEYNNPETGADVNVSRPSFFEDNDGVKVTSEDGRVTFEATDGVEGDVQFELVVGAGDAAERTVNASVDTTAAEAGGGGNGSGGGLVYLGDGAAFDGADSNTNPGGFNFSLRNTYASNVTVTDVTLLPEDDDSYGLSDEAPGYGYGRSELYVESQNTGESATVEAPLIAGDQYLYVGARGLTLDLTEDRTEEIYDSGGSSGTVTTNASGAGVSLGTDDVVEVAFAELYSGTSSVDVTGDDFRVSVTYEQDGTSKSQEFLVYAQPPGDAAEGADPTLESSSVTDTSDTGGNNNERRARFDVSYSVSDPDGNFDRVEVEFDNGNPPDTETITSQLLSDTVSYEGTQGSASSQASDYTITIRVYNTNNEVVDTETYTESPDGTVG